MPRIPKCERCCLCAHDYHLVCALYPDGPDGDTCLDFETDPELESRRFIDFLGLQQQQSLEPEELWEPEAASFSNGELILQPQERWPREEQLELLDYTHPLFTGCCPECGAQFERDYQVLVHWDCGNCGWKDDSV